MIGRSGEIAKSTDRPCPENPVFRCTLRESLLREQQSSFGNPLSREGINTRQSQPRKVVIGVALKVSSFAYDIFSR